MTSQTTWAAKTDIGRVRKENQDRWLARPGDGLFAVADGMGGLRGGAEAATLALAALEDEFEKAPPGSHVAWEAVVHAVNERVCRGGIAISPVEGIGTTLTLLRFTAAGATVVHVGDSACFLARGGILRQLTEDHTVAAEAERRIAKGEHIAPKPWAGHLLTRCIGQVSLDRVDVAGLTVEPGDRFLLCSDGITKVLNAGTIGACLTSAPTPDEAVKRLVAAALAAGAPDNATGVAVFA